MRNALLSAMVLMALALPAAAQAEWTVMVYMAADNNLDKLALRDINAMETASYSSGKVNVIVQVDRSEFGDWKTCRRYKIKQDSNTNAIGSPMLQDLGEINSGSAYRLRTFVEWAKQSYPANRYSLIIWGHGRGYKGFCSDYKDSGEMDFSNAGNFTLEMGKVKTALGGKLQHMMFHNCFMGMWEAAWMCAPYADYLNVSQDELAMINWKGIFNSMNANPAMSGYSLGCSIIDQTSGERTMSLLSLGAMENVTDNVNRLALTLLKARKEGYESVQAGALNSSLKFGTAPSVGTSYQYYIDLLDYANRLKNGQGPVYMKKAAGDMASAVLNAVKKVKNTTPYLSAGGISIYHCGFSGAVAATDYQYINYPHDYFWRNYLDNDPLPNYAVTVPQLYYWESATTPTGMTGDDATVTLNLPFTFNLYGPSSLWFNTSPNGANYTKVHVSTNGLLSFDGPTTSWTPTLLPSITGPNALIAVFWRDLYVDAQASVTYYSSPSKFVVSWNNVRNQSNANRQTFQCVLYPNGSFKVIVMSCTNDKPTAMGVENRSGTLGVCNARIDDYLSGYTPNTPFALVYTQPSDWNFGRGKGDESASHPDPALPTPAPGALALEVSPNPVRARASFNVHLPSASRVVLTVYNIAGQTVARLADENLPAGSHGLELDMTRAGSAPLKPGTYICRLEAGTASCTRRFVVVR